MPNDGMLQRVAKAIKKEVGWIISQEMKDPRVGMASVVSVDLSPDFGLARIYVSVMGDEEQQQRAMEGLESARGYIRSEIGKRLDFKYVPKIQFILDHSMKQGAQIERLLRRIREDDEDEHPQGPR